MVMAVAGAAVVVAVRHIWQFFNSSYHHPEKICKSTNDEAVNSEDPRYNTPIGLLLRILH